MDLTVILGPPGSGKAGRAVQVLREAAAPSGANVFLCVPGTVDRTRFLRELAGSRDGVLVGVEVGTFDQLVARVAGSPPVRRTDRAMERIVVRDALRDVPAFAPAARWSGFVDTAREQVDRLRRARAWGGIELERVEQDLPGEDIASWRRLEARVGELLGERRLRDDAWFEKRAATQLRTGSPGVGAVVVYGFEALAPSRVELLERLARHVPVTVTLAWRPGRRVHERAADLRDRWRNLGAHVEELDPVPTSERLLDWLGSELFEDSPSGAPETDLRPDTAAPVAFVDCSGPMQEAEEVVREVALLGGRGFAWDDVVVASASAAHDGDLLLAAFRRADIPARLQARRSAIDVPAGRAVHDLLDAILERDGMRLVAALRAPVFGVEPARVDTVELRLRRERHHVIDLLERPALRYLLPKPVMGIVASRRGGAVPAVRELLGSLLPGDIGELDLLRGMAALTEGLVVAAGGEEAVTLDDIRDAIAAFPLATPDRSDSGVVVIASLDDLRSLAFDAVVLRGTHLAAFRANVDDEHEAPAAARDLLHLAVTRARRTLRVVRQSTSSSGGHLAPSPAWQELRRLLPDAPLRTRRLGDVVVAPEHVRLDCEVERSVAFATGRGLHVAGVSPAQRATFDALRRPVRSAQLTGDVAAALAERRTIGVTEVEQYATCSARWFIERQLRVDDPDDDRSRIIDGRLAHELLQHLVPDARAGGADVGDVRRHASQIAPGLAAQIDEHGVLDQARIERITEHVIALIEAESGWVAPDSIDVERSFGRDAPDSIGPGYDVAGVEIVGRIDRIDRHGSRVLLHDYKYGSTDRTTARLLEDRNLQLLVYWLALEQPDTALEPMGAVYRAITNAGSASGVLSEELKEIGVIGSRSRSALTPEARRDLLDATAELVSSAVTNLRAGRVEPLADPSRCPTHCQLQAICRVGEAAP